MRRSILYSVLFLIAFLWIMSPWAEPAELGPITMENFLFYEQNTERVDPTNPENYSDYLQTQIASGKAGALLATVRRVQAEVNVGQHTQKLAVILSNAYTLASTVEGFLLREPQEGDVPDYTESQIAAMAEAALSAVEQARLAGGADETSYQSESLITHPLKEDLMQATLDLVQALKEKNP